MTELIKVTYNNDRPADCRTNPIHRIKENAMGKKYILTDDVIDFNGHTLHRIKAVRDFDCVKAGDLGGFIESEKNLDHDGDAWVTDSARVTGDARVTDSARVSGAALVTGDAWVTDSARVSGAAWVSGSALVSGDAIVTGDARVTGAARVSGAAWVSGAARVSGDAWVSGAAVVSGAAIVTGDARVTDSARVSGAAWVSGAADFAVISGFGRVFRTTTFFRCKDNLVRCKCGCFYGTVDEFRSKVRETHGNSKYAKEYLMIADLMELHFKED